MALLRLISLGVLAAVGAVAVAPSTARACSFDPCADSAEFGMLRVSHETVTTDGVLLLSSSQGESDALTPEAAIARMTVVVTDEDVELSGTIEHTAGEYFWRPDVPLVAGTSLGISVSMEANPDDIDQCGAAAGGDSTVTVLDETLPALELPSIEFATDYRFSGEVDFDTAICCDDGTIEVNSCDTPGFSGSGFCVAPSGVGYAQASVTVGELPANLGPSVAIEYLIDGEAAYSRDGLEPLTWGASRPATFEIQLRITSLIDGSTLLSDPFTVDGDNPGALGEQVIDVAAELEANCEGEPYTCETEDEFGWDLETCTPYDDGGTDTSGSDSDSSGSDSDSDSGSGGSDSDSSDSDSSGADSDSSGADSDSSGSDTDGDPGQDDGGGGCSVGGSGLGSAWLLFLGFAGVFRRRR